MRAAGEVKVDLNDWKGPDWISALLSESSSGWRPILQLFSRESRIPRGCDFFAFISRRAVRPRRCYVSSITMRALVVDSGKLSLRDEPTPAPSAGEVLIKVSLAGICATDLEILKGYAGFKGILGHEFVGVVTIGPDALINKRVVGEINCVCGRCDMCTSGLSSHCRRRTVVGIQGRPGVFAEFVALPERNCHLVPDGVTDAEAVFTEPLAAAHQVLRQIKLETKTSVAVIGTGRLGLLVAQVLSQFPCRLIAVGRNPRTLDLLDRKRIRTSNVAEFSQWGEQDVVIECTGSPEGLPLAMRMVRPKGTIILKTTCATPTPADLTPLVVNEIALLGSRCGPFSDALGALARKQVDVQSMISKQMPLSEAVAAMSLAADPNHTKILLACNT